MKKLEPKGRNDSHVFDYSKITDDIYIGSDLCKGGICLIHGDEFKSLGIGVEMNLSAERNELPPKDLETYVWIPVVDGYSPTQEQLDLGTSVINDAVRNEKTFFIHCKNGHGRSPTMVAAYFIRFKRYGVDDAINFIAKKRPEIHIEDNQRQALEKFKSRWLK